MTDLISILVIVSIFGYIITRQIMKYQADLFLRYKKEKQEEANEQAKEAETNYEEAKTAFKGLYSGFFDSDRSGKGRRDN
jgi:hypothetical protein